MRRVYALAGWITLALAAPGVEAAAPADAPDAELPKLQYLKSDKMSIGVSAPAADRGGAQPIEVQLHVSEDRGRHWKKTLVVKPSATAFTFKAPHDGEYWFMARTLYPGNQLRPNEPPRPMSRALIDTVPPTLDLEARRGDAGEIHVRWTATDAHLDPQSLTIEYQPAGPNSAWQLVALDTPRADVKGEYRGEVDVVPQGAVGRITLRAEVKDRAKNEMITERLVPPPEQTDQRPGQRTTRATVTKWEPTPSGRLQPEEGEQSSADAPPAGMSSAFPADTADAEPIAPGNVARDRRRQHEPPDEEIPLPRHDGHRTVAGQVHPPNGEPYFPQDPDDEDEPGDAFQGELLPPGIRPHYVNKREFEMVYDVDGVGSSGVAQVELWATRDGGRRWENFGDDDDCQSPMLIEVDQEGIYGFRVVIENGAGRRGLAPQAGDLPEVWVAVDLTKPNARLISAEQGTGDEAGELVVAWEADDEQLAARPIALSFSDSPGGPWTTIASGLKNTRSYAWRLDRRVAEQIYLRLEVRDEAGNVTVIETPDPLTISRARPTGRIRDIRARDDSADRPRTIRNLIR